MMSAPLTLPPLIAPHVRRYVRLRRRHALTRATGLAAAAFLAWGLGCCMIDRAAALAPATRLGLLLAGLVAAVSIIFRPLAYWLARGVNWCAAAAEIERQDPSLAQRLQTVTSATLEPDRFRASAEIVDELSREVTAALSARPPSHLLRWRPTLAPWLLVCALISAAVVLVNLPAVGMPRLAMRFVVPLRPVPPVTTTRLMLHPTDTSVVENESLRVTVSAQRLQSGGVTLHHTRPDDAWIAVPMSRRGTDAFEAVVAAVTHDLRYFARGGDAQTPTAVARVLRKPVLTQARVRYTYPPYTNRAPLTITNTDGLIEAPVGTQADVTFVASVPLASGTIHLDGQKIELAAGEDARERRGTLPLFKEQAYSIFMVSADHVAGTGPGKMSIRAIPDRPPLVQVLQPPGELRLHPRDILSLPFQALDDYGVTSLTTNVQITASGVDASGEPINLAQGKPATQPLTWAGAEAARAVDGNTDGNFLAGSVTHTDLPGTWWQVDLGNVTPVAVVEVWNRADAMPQRLSDFFVFVSDAPFLSDDPAAIAAQPGVATHRINGQCGRPTAIDVFRTARFVRVQLSKPDYLSLAEVRVLQAKPVPAGELASRSFNSNIAVSGDARQQEGEAYLDLAKINVGVGDVITVSVTATDTGQQVATGGPVRVVVSPRSIDQRAYDRIAELRRAAPLTISLVSQLDAAVAAFAPASARGVGHIDAYLAAMASANRELAGVSETTAVLQSVLLRCIIRSDGAALSVALAGMIDDLQQITGSATAISSRLGFDTSPSEADRAALGRATATARRMAQHVATILRGEQAGAVLADLDNLRASEQGTPSGKEAAERARERTRRVREDVVAAAKELGLALDAADAVAKLQAVAAGRGQVLGSYSTVDYIPAAKEYVAALSGDNEHRSALVQRLSAAAQAEAVRPDANLIRARDLHLAASAALRVRESPPATRGQFLKFFAPALAALQADHAATAARSAPTTATATAPATTVPTTTAPTATAPTTAQLSATAPAAQTADPAPTAAAVEARRQLAMWAQGQSDDVATEADAAARAQALALQANADLAARDYESAEEADERIALELRLAERTFPRAAERFEQARQQVRRSTDRARRIDQVAERQQSLAERARQPARADVAVQQRELAAAVARETDGAEKEVRDDRSDTRVMAVNAIQSAQERLAAMPQQLRELEGAIAERAAAAGRLRAAQDAQVKVAEEGRAAAARAVRGAEQQLRDAEARLAERLRAVGEVAALEMTRSLAPFAPETGGAVRAVREQLHPAIGDLHRASGGGADRAAVAVINVRAAIEAVQTELKAAQAALLERDPLFAARVYAAAAAAALANVAPPAGDAAAHQERASAALARAWDASVHEAAAARLAGLPTMRPLFAPPPDAGQPPATAAQGVASKFPMFFEWGRLPWRSAQPLNATPRASDPPGYQDALRAYFEALGATRQATATQPTP